MPQAHPLYCSRCADDVSVIRPWRGWRAAWLIWRIVMVVALIFSPFLSADYCVMLPSLMLMLAAGGPLYRYARTKPACRRCLLELEEVR